MKRLWTIIGVRDVPASARWYEEILACSKRQAHAGWAQVVDRDGTVLLCLHQWGEHEHPTLMSPEVATPGNGLLLFFRVDDFDAALQRARALVASFEEEPHQNRNTGTMEFSIRDPDAYLVTISAE